MPKVSANKQKQILELVKHYQEIDPNMDIKDIIESIAMTMQTKNATIRDYYTAAKKNEQLEAYRKELDERYDIVDEFMNEEIKTDSIEEYAEKMLKEVERDSYKDDSPIVSGITADESVDFESEILPYLMKIGAKAEIKNDVERSQVIDMGYKPFAIAMLSDVHGGAKADYKAIQDDLSTISSTKRMYAIAAGDICDNFIIGKLQSVQKFQSTTIDMEQRFLRWFFEKLKGSLVAVCSGNHDDWTKKISAIDPAKEILKGVDVLFGSSQIKFDLKWGNNTHKYLVRHKFKHSSIFNPTHGMEVFWERGDNEFDVAISGHTHIATLCRPFIKHDKERFAILLGTYKLRDEFGRECGFADTHSDSRGCGAMCYNPETGQVFWTRDLKTASDLLKLWGE